MNHTTVSIILPCLNEADAIPNCIRHLIQLQGQLKIQNQNLEVILVDDGSIDGSASLAVRLLPSVKVIRNEKTSGYGQALKSGFNLATGDYVAMMDVDNTYDPKDILNLQKKLMNDSLDLVLGFRSEQTGGFSHWRLFGNRVMRFFASRLLFCGNMDICSGMRFMRKDLAKQLTQVEQNGFSFAIAMLEFCHHQNKKMGQVQISYSKRLGDSKLNSLFEGVTHLSLIFRFWLNRTVRG